MNRVSTLLTFAFALSGVVPQAHALEKSTSRIRGNSVWYTAGRVTECGAESVGLYAFESHDAGDGGFTEAVILDYYSYDDCTGANLHGYAVLDSASFDVKKLTSASISVTTTLAVESCHWVADEYVCEHQAELPVSIDFSCTASGPVWKDRSSNTSTTPTSRYRFTSTGQLVETVVSGSISVGDLSIDAASGEALLSYSMAGTFTKWQ